MGNQDNLEDVFVAVIRPKSQVSLSSKEYRAKAFEVNVEAVTLDRSHSSLRLSPPSQNPLENKGGCSGPMSHPLGHSVKISFVPYRAVLN